MKNTFVVQEWQSLCDRLRQTAIHFGAPSGKQASFTAQAEAFSQQTPANRYDELLARVRDAAELSRTWHPDNQSDDLEIGSTDDATLDEATLDEAAIDETLDESFPASDPPAWTDAHA